MAATGTDPPEALLQSQLDEFLRSPAVAPKIIERVSTETRLPALLVRLAYFWLGAADEIWASDVVMMADFTSN